MDMNTVQSAPAPSAAVMGLDTLGRNVPARVVDLRAGHGEEEQELLLRLMEIGFLPGERVRIVATGFPGPDPLAVRVGQRVQKGQALLSVEARYTRRGGLDINPWRATAGAPLPSMARDERQ